MKKLLSKDEYSKCIEDSINMCKEVLLNKKQEYATKESNFHNFEVAAVLEGVSNRQALAGMMAKHTVSIYDMCKSTENFPIEKWNEKIIDNINYLLILRAMIVMGKEE